MIKTERWNHGQMKRFYKKAVSLILAAVCCMSMMTGCEALDTTLPPPEEKQVEKKERKAYPQKAISQIYQKVGKKTGLKEPTQEEMETELGFDFDDIEEAYVRYVETDFGVSDVYILLPKQDEDGEKNEHRDNVLMMLRKRKDDRIREFANYDVYNSREISENGVLFERGGYVVLLMLENNDSARRIVEKYIPEKLNIG